MAESSKVPQNRTLLALRGILNGFLTIVLFGIPLFPSASTLNFPNAWIFLGIFAISFAAILVYLSLTNPEYAMNRMKGEESETPQKIVMGLLVSSALLMLVIAGLDFRFRWSHVPNVVVVIASAIMAVTFILLFFVMKQNAYASRVIEIQENQKVISTGAYAIVRHPMYSVFVIMFLAVPFVLGSWFAIIPALSIPFLLSFRIRNEEEVLKKGLEGYEVYMKKTRFRLIPWLW
jgi:protein-S-isoprenylcysteine O-methyltransferase Ste14